MKAVLAAVQAITLLEEGTAVVEPEVVVATSTAPPSITTTIIAPPSTLVVEEDIITINHRAGGIAVPAVMVTITMA